MSYRPQQLIAKEIESIVRRRATMRKRAIKYLRKVRIRIIEDAPKTLEEFEQFWRDRRIPGVLGINSFARHELTNYTAICHNVYHQFEVAMDDELKAIVHPRVNVATGRYLHSIGWFDEFEKELMDGNSITARRIARRNNGGNTREAVRAFNGGVVRDRSTYFCPRAPLNSFSNFRASRNQEGTLPIPTEDDR